MWGLRVDSAVRVHTAVVEEVSWFSALMPGGSQPPITPAPRDPAPSCTHLHMATHKHAQIHITKSKTKDYLRVNKY